MDSGSGKPNIINMNVKIVHISVWEVVKLHFQSFIYGIYLIVKRFVKWAWNPKNFFVLQQRDKPPQCLVDNSLGEHSYVKLKVSCFIECMEKIVNIVDA